MNQIEFNEFLNEYDDFGVCNVPRRSILIVYGIVSGIPKNSIVVANTRQINYVISHFPFYKGINFIKSGITDIFYEKKELINFSIKYNELEKIISANKKLNDKIYNFIYQEI